MMGNPLDREGDGMTDESATPAEVPEPAGRSVPASEVATVVVVRFESSRAAERMVASLGRSFRREARAGNVAAFVVTRKGDGSFKLVQSRVVTASGVVGATMTFTAATLAGFMGAGSALRGAKAVGHGARERQTGVGGDDDQLAAVFDQLGPHAAYVLFVCTDDRSVQAVVTRAGESGSHTSQHSQAEVLALLDRLGSDYDWIRPSVTEPVSKGDKRHKSAHEPPTST
jgi:uncharacterized membrane protein